MSNLQNTESILLSTDDTKKQLRRLAWRQDVIRILHKKGFVNQSDDLRNCGCSCFVRICKNDLSHEPEAIPVHCGLRICPECEARESYRKLARYLPALQALLQPNPDLPDYRLRKLVLTTPYGLNSLTSESFKQKQRLVNDFLNVYFFWYFHEKGELSSKEIRSGRCNLKQHGIGGLRSSEFGERGKKLHWHILIYSPFMPHDDIVAVWKDVTGDECQVASISGVKARTDDIVEDGGDLIGAVQEIVKYATKFTSLKPSDVPQLYRVLKGNRRFQSFGVLYDIDLPEEDVLEHVCAECGGVKETVSVGQYVTRCQNHNVPPSDSVADEVERGIALYLSREPEISSGKSSNSLPKPRDSIESVMT